jgi:hypothetical protein
LAKALDCINLLIDIRCPAQLKTVEPLFILIQISFAFVRRADVYWRCHAVLKNVEVYERVIFCVLTLLIDERQEIDVGLLP